MLKRQHAESFGGLREQVFLDLGLRARYPCSVCSNPDPGVHHRETGQVCAASDDRSLYGMSREGLKIFVERMHLLTNILGH
jgi:hypothetical protein